MNTYRTTLLAMALALSSLPIAAESRDCTGMTFARIETTFNSMKAASQDSVLRISGCNPELLRGSASDIKKLVTNIAVAQGMGNTKQILIQHVNNKQTGYTFTTMSEYGTLCGRISNSTNSVFLYISGYETYDPYVLAESVRRMFKASKAHVEVSLRA